MTVVSMEDARLLRHAALEDEARLAFVHRDFARALDAAQRSLRFVPGCVQGHILVGDSLCALGREDAALRAYRLARRLAPDRAEPVWSIALVHALAGRWRVALRYLDHAQSCLRRGDGMLYEWIPEDRAVALIKLGRHREALEAVRWGLRRRPKGKRLLDLRRWLLHRAPGSRQHLRLVPACPKASPTSG